MNTVSDYFYTGEGKEKSPEDLQRFPKSNPDELKEPSKYRAPSDLADAVNVALTLGLPLLLTGEPGCGKSQLAYSLAYEYGLPEKSVIKFIVKSDTQSRDLFYNYDTLGRFRASQGHKENEIDSRKYIRFEALGRAILCALGHQGIKAQIGEDGQEFVDFIKEIIPPDPRQSIVLIDEIDKAPREVPNDILNEIENMEFDIPELFEPGKNERLVLKEKKLIALGNSPQRPIIIITSNQERELPEAFLRRCVYFHLTIPPFRDIPNSGEQNKPTSGNSSSNSNDPNVREQRIVTIEQIIEERLNISIQKHPENISNAEKSVWAGCISFFAHLRKSRLLQKPPSTAELLSWMQLLHKRHLGEIEQTNPQVSKFKHVLRDSAKITLFKHQVDQKQAENLFNDWLKLTS